MLSNDDDKKQNEDDNETISQKKQKKDLNDLLDEIIEKSKSFEEQIKLLEKLVSAL